MPSFSCSPVGNYALVAGVTVALLALLWLGPMRDKVSLARRRALIGLRLLIIALVALAMLRPAMVHSRVTRQSATLIVMLDDSRSMSVADAAGKQTRWEALRASLTDAWPRLQDLSRDLQVKVVAFSAEAAPLELAAGPGALPAKPEGEQTAIGSVLEDLLRRLAGQRLGVIMVGDGAQRAIPPRDLDPQSPAAKLADLGCRFYAVPLGQDRGLGQTHDVALEDLRAPREVFVKNRLTIDAVGRFDGFANQTLAVQMLVEAAPGVLKPVAAQQIQPTTDGQRVPLHFEYVPETVGELKVVLQVAAQNGELVTTNNTVSTFVTVRAGGLNVLYLEGAARVEQKFLRRALDASDDIRVDYLRIDPRRPETRPADLLARFEPGKYNVYLLGDLDARAFQADELTALSAAIERGAGLMLLGGVHSYGPGGYANTPLAAAIPIEMDALERQSFDEAVRTDVHLASRARFRPTRVGQLQSFFQIATAANSASIWDQLPPLDGANRFGKLKPGALPLAESERGETLLVAKDFGLGRVLAFAGDSTWHWAMHGFVDQHRRFWRQTILWLARKDQSHDGRVWLALDQQRLAPGMRLEFDLGAQSPEGVPLLDATFQVEVATPDGRSLPARVQRQDSGHRGVFLDAAAPGDYTVRVTAAQGGSPLGSAQARFLVYEQDLELDNPAADRGTLQSLASLTGGRLVAPEQLAELLAEIKDSVRELEVVVEEKKTLWDTWGFFCVFIGLLTTEWYFRKKWGLV